jgi:hypothetical protein
MIWPIIAGAIYLFLTIAPNEQRQKLPPVVLHWAPFAVALAGILIAKPLSQGFLSVISASIGGADAKALAEAGVDPSAIAAQAADAAGGGSELWLYTLGYTLLLFGLLARLAQPTDPFARIVIGAGAGMLFVPWLDFLSYVFHFNGPILGILHNLIFFAVMTVGVGCLLFVINGVRFGTVTIKLPPALAALDAFVPLVAAILIAWLPFQVVFLMLKGIIDGKGISQILESAHALLPILAYFGVLMCTAPAAYDALIHAIKKNQAGGPPQAPPGGGYPPPGGGYPPQGGGYPPQGGGYPPQGGGYPPQGGGYPPQGGGGWPQQ